MIELNKCPNCASEDRVTIAGKDFCMRCGTPSEDNAVIGGAQTDSTAPGPTQVAGLTRFGDASQPAPQPSTEANQAQQNPPEPISTQLATPQLPADTVTAPAAQINQSIPVNGQPQQAVSASEVAQEANIDTPQSVIPPNATDNQATSIVQTPPVQPQSEPELSTQSEPASTMISTLPPTAEVGTASADSQATINSQPTESVAVAPTPETSASVTKGLAEGANVSQDPQAVMISNTMPQQASSNTMPVQDEITLEKEEPGVFSDEDFKALNNTSSSPIPQQPPLIQTPTNFVASPAPTLSPLPQTQVAAPSTNFISQPVQSGSSPSSDSAKLLKPLGVAASIALVFFAGYYLWLINYPSLAFKIASSKAGISAGMPAYVPEGYKLNGNIQTSPGNVSYSLANQASKRIQISQTRTDWDSQALAENYVAPKADNYLALQAQGLTIYMMGNNQASWVNKGTWYRVESPAQPLTQEQVIKMATSL